MTKRFSFLVLGLMILAVLVVGCGGQTNPFTATEEESYPIALTATKVSGEDNCYLLTWDPLENQFEQIIWAEARGCGGLWVNRGISAEANSYYLYVDVNTAYKMHVSSYDHKDAMPSLSNTVDLFISVPLDYLPPVNLDYEKPIVEGEGLKFNIVWSKTTDSSMFDRYELWDISKDRLGYYDPWFADSKIFESSDINTVNYERTINKASTLTYYDTYIVYVVSKSGKRTPSNYIQVVDD